MRNPFYVTGLDLRKNVTINVVTYLLSIGKLSKLILTTHTRVVMDCGRGFGKKDTRVSL